MPTLSEMAKRDPHEWNKVADIADRYYVRKQAQRDIAKALGISPTEVSRCVRLAEEWEIVQFVVKRECSEDHAKTITEAFRHLKKVIVVPVMNLPETKTSLLVERLGIEAACYLAREIPHKASIGIGCGTSVEATVNHLVQLSQAGERVPMGCELAALMTFMMDNFVNVAPASLVAGLMRWLPEAEGRAYQFPSTEGNWDIKDQYHKIKKINELINKTKEMDYYIIGIGFIDYEKKFFPFKQGGVMAAHEFNNIIHGEEIPKEFNDNRYLIERLSDHDMNAVGEILYQPYNNYGKAIEDIERKDEVSYGDIDNGEITRAIGLHCFWLRLKTLREIVAAKRATVVAIGGGEYKRDAILGALHGHFFNVLVTDSWTAEWLVDQVSREDFRDLFYDTAEGKAQ